MRSKTFIVFYSLLFICLLAACAKSPTPTPIAMHFDLIADESSLPLAQALVDAYTAERSYVTINLQRAPNSARALQTLEAGETDLLAVCWLPAEQTLWSVPFAQDAITLITHSSNPVAGLTLLQLRDAYMGRTLSWETLSGLAVELQVVIREEDSGTHTAFVEHVMGGRNLSLNSVIMPNGEAVARYVSKTPGALGYVSLGQVVPAVNVLSLDGVAPSSVTVSDGRYGLGRPLYLAARTAPPAEVQEFVDWVLGQGQQIVAPAFGRAP